MRVGVWMCGCIGRTLCAGSVLENSVSAHGDDDETQVPTRRAIDRNQNGPAQRRDGIVALWLSGSAAAAQMANEVFFGCRLSVVGCRLITTSKQIRLKLMRRFAFISWLAGCKCNCKQTQWQ